MTAATERLASKERISPVLPAFVLVDIKALQRHPNNRTRFNQASLEELGRSLLDEGQTTPITVRPHGTAFQILAGERRYRAAKHAGLTQLMAIIRPMDDHAAIRFVALENKQREDPDPLDEADLYHAMLKFEGESPATIAQAMSKPEKHIKEMLRLTLLLEVSRKLLIDEAITVDHAFLLASLSDADQKRAIASKKDSAYNIGGLFRDERTLFSDGKDERVVVSVAEFRDWIRHSVRLNPRAAVVQELLPETFDAVKQADAARQKVLYITTDYRVSDDARDEKVKTLGVNAWKRADGKKGSKPCPFAELAVDVAGEGQGQSFKVCARRDRCTVHWGEEVRAAARRAKERAKGQKKGASPKVDAEAEKKRAAEVAERERAKAEAFAAEKARWQKAWPEVRKAIVGAIGEMTVSQLAALALGEIRMAPQWRDLSSPGRTADDVLRHVVVAQISADIVPWHWENRDDYAINAITRLCKQVNLDARKLVDAFLPPPAKAELKKRAGDVAAARKAKRAKAGAR